MIRWRRLLLVIFVPLALRVGALFFEPRIPFPVLLLVVLVIGAMLIIMVLVLCGVYAWVTES